MDAVSEKDLTGRVALVTGASRGIGADIVRVLARRGAEVFAVARSRDRLAALADELAAENRVVHPLPADLSDSDAVEGLIPALREITDRLDILVNNAGILPKARRAQKISRADWNDALDVNLTTPWFLSCRAQELMTAGGGGIIVNVASTAAFYPSVGLAPYNVTKAALVMLTKVCALEWAAQGVRVLGVAPGKVDTDMIAPILEWSESTNTALNPMGRIASTAEIANVVSFLVSDAAAYMTGVVVPVDGGELLTSGR